MKSYAVAVFLCIRAKYGHVFYYIWSILLISMLFSKRWISFIPWLVILVIAIVGTFYRVGLDLWNDELYTLDKFTLVPIRTVLYDYHVPNNHILYNLFNHFVLNLFDVFNLNSLLSDPWILRVVSGVYSTISVVAIFFIAKEKWDKRTAILTVVFLLSSWPFMNYAFQIRGYALSSCLLSLLVLVLYRFDRSNLKYLLFASIVALSFALIVTVPLNLYVLLVIGLFFGGRVLFSWYKTKQLLSENHRSDLILATAVLLGALAALMFYVPIFSEVFFNEYTVSQHLFHPHTLEVFFHFLIQYLSNKWILLLVFVFGISMLKIRSFEPDKRKDIVLLLLLCFGPFVISFVRGDWPPSRSFVTLMPYFSLLLAVCTITVLKLFVASEKLKSNIVAVLSLYCGIVFVIDIEKSEQMSQYNLMRGKRMHDLNANFFQTDYAPFDQAKLLEKHNQANLPVILESTEEYGFKYYLDDIGMRYIRPENTDSVLKEIRGDYYVVSRRPFQVIKSLGVMPAKTVEILSDKLNFHTILLVKGQKKDAD